MQVIWEQWLAWTECMITCLNVKFDILISFFALKESHSIEKKKV